jgi:hypothetical protein
MYTSSSARKSLSGTCLGLGPHSKVIEAAAANVARDSYVIGARKRYRIALFRYHELLGLQTQGRLERHQPARPTTELYRR